MVSLPEEKISIGPWGLVGVPGVTEDQSLHPGGLHGGGDTLEN